MKLLLHTCCAPCLTYPYKILSEHGMQASAFFYNPNIHPFTEYAKRLNCLKDYTEEKGIKLIIKDDYAIEEFLRQVVFRENNRCSICYEIRLAETAKTAKSGKFDAFSTTMLISPYQKHDLIKSIGESVASEFDIDFFYKDFRKGYKESVSFSKDAGLYRQQYCGCIYSEKERYQRSAAEAEKHR
ncbi:MAG: epoxyqueuosine reductase QueH [bacterium]|nr:epoxyqueuosine reductase QueH [bacterium]